MSDRMKAARQEWLTNAAVEDEPEQSTALSAQGFAAGWEAALKPTSTVEKLVPLVLYFASEADAAEFVFVVRKLLPNLKESAVG